VLEGSASLESGAPVPSSADSGCTPTETDAAPSPLGAPCISPQEEDTSYPGAVAGEISVVTADPQCGANHVCLYNHFRGLASCPYGQDDAGRGPEGTADAGPPERANRSGPRRVKWSPASAPTGPPPSRRFARAGVRTWTAGPTALIARARAAWSARSWSRRWGPSRPAKWTPPERTASRRARRGTAASHARSPATRPRRRARELDHRTARREAERNFFGEPVPGVESAFPPSRTGPDRRSRRGGVLPVRRAPRASRRARSATRKSALVSECPSARRGR
jgi:hypothetical protein